MEWWLWIIGGLALLVVEVVIPGVIFFLFFGAAAIILGILGSVGLSGPVWFQWLLFSVLSIVSLMTLRSPIMRLLNKDTAGDPEIDSLVGQDVVLLRDLAPDSPGKAELRGTSWSVVGGAGVALPKGTRCVVEAVKGLTLHVRSAAPAESGKSV